MKKLLTILFVFTSLSCFGQIPADSIKFRADFDNRFNITPPGDGDYGVIGFFVDSDALGFDPSDIVVDSMWFEDVDNNIFIIRSVSGSSPLTLGLDAFGHSNDPAGGWGTIYKPTKTHKFPLTTGSEATASTAGKFSRMMYAIDSLLGVVTAPSTMFSGGSFTTPTTNILYEDGLGSWSTRFRSPSNNGYFGIYSDLTDDNFLGLRWVTLRGNHGIGEDLTKFEMYSASDMHFTLSNSLDRYYFNATFDIDNTNTKVLAIDPVTKELEQVDLSTIGGNNNLAVANQTFTANRYVSGSNLYKFIIDSIPIFRLHADEYFVTDDSTSLLNIIGTTTKYQKRNVGLSRLNSIGLDFLYFQNTNDNDEFHRLSISANDLGISSKKKEVVGNASYGSEATFDPDFLDFNMSDSISASRAKIRLARDKITITAPDSLVLDIGAETYNENLNTVLAIDPATKRVYYKTVETGIVSFDTYASGFMTTTVSRYGGSATIITNPTAGQYTYTIAASGYPITIDFEGQTTSLNGSNELVLVIDNTANARSRIFSVQLISKAGNSQVNAFATGTNYTQSVSGYITTITIPNMNGFGVTGYKVMLR